jgi:hypothetical protein
MTTSVTSARASVSLLSNPVRVTYPAPSLATRQTSETLVLIGLTNDLVDAPEREPLVSLSSLPTADVPGPSYRKRSGKRTLKFDVGNELRSLGDILIPGPVHLPKPHLLRQRQLFMDEGYLHATLCNWETKSELDRALIVASGMPTTSTHTFSVDFSEARQRSLGLDLAQAFRKLRNDVSQLARLGPTVATLEHDRDGRLHLHGIVTADVDVAALRQILIGLGGKVSSIPFRNLYQVDIKPATFTLGWLMYITKTLIKLPEADASKRIYMSSSARLLGKGHLVELRKAAERKLGIKPELRGRAAVYSRSTRAA